MFNTTKMLTNVQVFAAESALLFVPQTTWLALSKLLSDDAEVAGVLLREVPAIGTVARQEIQLDGSYSVEFKGVVKYVLSRAMYVLGSLPHHDYEKAEPVANDADWREVSEHYERRRR